MDQVSLPIPSKPGPLNPDAADLHRSGPGRAAQAFPPAGDSLFPCALLGDAA